MRRDPPPPARLRHPLHGPRAGRTPFIRDSSSDAACRCPSVDTRTPSVVPLIRPDVPVCVPLFPAAARAAVRLNSNKTFLSIARICRGSIRIYLYFNSNRFLFLFLFSFFFRVIKCFGVSSFLSNNVHPPSLAPTTPHSFYSDCRATGDGRFKKNGRCYQRSR